MDRQNRFDVARMIEELAMNAESAGAKLIKFILSPGKLVAEDDGGGMGAEQFALAKRGLFTTKGEERGKGIKLIADNCASVTMLRRNGKTVITCLFADLDCGDIAGAVSLAAAGDTDVIWAEKADRERAVFCGAAKGDALLILENKKRIYNGKIIW